LPGKFRSA